MRIVGLVVLAAVLGGCTTVKVAQRDGCWVRETKQTLRGTKQEVGPCARAQPQWAEDRLTRLVQECVAQADHRWQVRAVAAWNRGEPLPVQESEESVVALCMGQAATGAVTQTERLSERLEDVTRNLAQVDRDRAALRAESAETLAHLRESNDRIAEYLGEAAKRPPPVATATASATSDGTAVTESGLRSETGSASHGLPALPGLPVVPAAAQPPPAGPASAPAPLAKDPAPPAAPAAGPPAARPPAAARASETAAKRPAPRAAAPRKPVVRATTAAPCEVPVAACSAPAGDAAAAAPAAGSMGAGDGDPPGAPPR